PSAAAFDVGVFFPASVKVDARFAYKDILSSSLFSLRESGGLHQSDEFISVVRGRFGETSGGGKTFVCYPA
ncbi:hypothetical protein NQZ68_023666, partial [Dissostichus eleginoides]